jgi:hypothetical protein
MQTAEGRGDGSLLGLSDRVRAWRLAWHLGHGDQGRAGVQLCPDGPRRKPGRIACQQRQRPPLATRLITIEPPLTTIDG